MKYDARSERKKFWDIFEEKLIENGEPFSIAHEKRGEPLNWAAINKSKRSVEQGLFFDKTLSVDFLVREEIARVNISIKYDQRTIDRLKANKAEIESMIDAPIEWVPGAKNPNSLRIQHIIPVEIGNTSNYADVIDSALPILVDMKRVCDKYANKEFFDF